MPVQGRRKASGSKISRKEEEFGQFRTVFVSSSELAEIGC